MSYSNTVINPKPCSYNCGTRIYWSITDNAFLETLSRQKHYCKNRPASKPSAESSQGNTNTNRPYYNKKPGPRR
jgi:hypothetical protein